MNIDGSSMNSLISNQEGKFISRLITIIMILMLLAFSVSGQMPVMNSYSRENTDNSETKNEAERNWLFSTEVLYYIVPDGQNIIWPIFSVNHNWLHIEGRYNYEDLKTFSAWIGYNFIGGKKMKFEITPMAGGVVGNTSGIGLGTEISLYYNKFEFNSESEYVFDMPDPAGSFLYTWSELSFSAPDWLRYGIAVQHTKEYRTNAYLQRGGLVGISWKNASLTGYVFDPDKNSVVYVIGLIIDF